MNNFTKEELESLRASIIATQINHSGFYGDKRVYENATKLCDKIEALIDNYCESTSVGNVGSNSVVITGDSLKHLASNMTNRVMDNMKKRKRARRISRRR